MKKALAIITILIFLVSLASCNGNATTAPTTSANNTTAPTTAATTTAKPIASYVNIDQWPIVKDSITLKVMGPKGPLHVDWSEMVLWQWLTEQTNIKFTFNTPAKDAFKEKKSLAFASKDLPDLFIGASIDSIEVVKYGVQQGLLAKLENLFDYGKNIKAAYAEYPDIYASQVAEDGFSYTIGNIGLPIWTATGRHLFINNVWLTATGKSSPKTIDEYLDVLRAFKGAKDLNGNGSADEIPVVYTENLRTCLLEAYGIFTNSFEIARDNGEVIYAPITEAYKHYLTTMYTMWTEGLVDIDSFSQTNTEVKAKAAKMQYGSFAGLASFIIAPASEILKYDMLTPLTSDLNSKPAQLYNGAFSPGSAAITSACQYPEAAMLLLDWMYTQEGALSMSYGVPKKNWTILDSGAHAFILADGTMGADDKYRATLTIAPGLSIPINMRASKDTYEKNYTDSKNNYNNSILYDQITKYAIPYIYNPTPNVIMTSNEVADIQPLTDLNSYVTQMEAKFITGQINIETGWDEYVKTCKSMDFDKMLAAYKSAWTRYQKNQAVIK